MHCGSIYENLQCIIFRLFFSGAKSSSSLSYFFIIFRFASFIEGSSHILDEEVLEYETFRAEISDDSDSDDDNNEQQQYHHHQTQQNTSNRFKNSYSNSNGHISSSNMIRHLQTSTPIEERSNQTRRRYIPAAVEFSDDD